MLVVTWQIGLVLIESIIFIPLYILIWIAIQRKRKTCAIFQNHYYTFVISQTTIDLYSLFFIVTMIFPQYFDVGKNLISSTSPRWIATIYSNCDRYFFLSRLFGVFLITNQRYLTICCPLSTITSKLNNSNPITLILFQWIFSFSIYSPALCMTNFESMETLYIIYSQEDVRVYSIMLIPLFAIICPIIIFMYFRILLVICSKRSNSGSTSKARYQEHRLCFHIFLLTIISTVVFLYQITELVTTQQFLTYTVTQLRLYLPLFSSNFSFINPLVLILLNRDIQSAVNMVLKSEKTPINQKTILVS